MPADKTLIGLQIKDMDLVELRRSAPPRGSQSSLTPSKEAAAAVVASNATNHTGDGSSPTMSTTEIESSINNNRPRRLSNFDQLLMNQLPDTPADDQQLQHQLHQQAQQQPHRDPASATPVDANNNSKEATVIDLLASTFVLNEQTWQALDGGKSRLALCETPLPIPKYRVVALSLGNEYVINCWIKADCVFQKVSDVFCTFTSGSKVSGGATTTYGCSFQSKETATKFCTVLESTLAKLRAAKPPK